MAEALAYLEDPVEYPESDGKPVESMKQWGVVAQVAMALRRGVLNLHFRAVPGEEAPQLLGPDGDLLLSHEDAAAQAEQEVARLRAQIAALRAGKGVDPT